MYLIGVRGGFVFLPSANTPLSFKSDALHPISNLSPLQMEFSVLYLESNPLPDSNSLGLMPNFPLKDLLK